MALKTVILTPFRASPERERVWRFVQAWIARNYAFPHFVADSEGTIFSAAQARNRAARLAGDWDVAVIHDADTIAHPDAVSYSIGQAQSTKTMVYACDSHMYCDRPSTNRILTSGVPAFARPTSFDNTGIYQRPSGGIMAVPRLLWEQVGGYVESLNSWGFEDLVFLQMCGLFGNGYQWTPGHITLHLWHPPAEKTTNTMFNEHVWRRLADYRMSNNPDAARHYLATLGHTVP